MPIPKAKIEFLIPSFDLIMSKYVNMKVFLNRIALAYLGMIINTCTCKYLTILQLQGGIGLWFCMVMSSLWNEHLILYAKTMRFMEIYCHFQVYNFIFNYYYKLKYIYRRISLSNARVPCFVSSWVWRVPSINYSCFELYYPEKGF